MCRDEEVSVADDRRAEATADLTVREPTATQEVRVDGKASLSIRRNA